MFLEPEEKGSKKYSKLFMSERKERKKRFKQAETYSSFIFKSPLLIINTNVSFANANFKLRKVICVHRFKEQIMPRIQRSSRIAQICI